MCFISAVIVQKAHATAWNSFGKFEFHAFAPSVQLQRQFTWKYQIAANGQTAVFCVPLVLVLDLYKINRVQVGGLATRSIKGFTTSTSPERSKQKDRKLLFGAQTI